MDPDSRAATDDYRYGVGLAEQFDEFGVYVGDLAHRSEIDLPAMGSIGGISA